MTNLLEQAISTDNSNRAGKIIRDALGIATRSLTIAFPGPGRRIVSSEQGLLASGCTLRRDFWSDNDERYAILQVRPGTGRHRLFVNRTCHCAVEGQAQRR